MTNVSDVLLLQAAPNLPKSPPSDDFWLPRAASVTTDNVDWVWDFLVYVSAISALAILGVMIYFVFKYRANARSASYHAKASRDETPNPGTSSTT